MLWVCAAYFHQCLWGSTLVVMFACMDWLGESTVFVTTHTAFTFTLSDSLKVSARDGAKGRHCSFICCFQDPLVPVHKEVWASGTSPTYNFFYLVLFSIGTLPRPQGLLS